MSKAPRIFLVSLGSCSLVSWASSARYTLILGLWLGASIAANAQQKGGFTMKVDGLVDNHAMKSIADVLVQLDPMAQLRIDPRTSEVTMLTARLIAMEELTEALALHGYSVSELTLLGDVVSKPEHTITEADVRRALDLPQGHALDGAEYERLKKAWIANDPEGYHEALQRSQRHQPSTDEE